MAPTLAYCRENWEKEGSVSKIFAPKTDNSDVPRGGAAEPCRGTKRKARDGDKETHAIEKS